jgi:hypothetical protein
MRARLRETAALAVASWAAAAAAAPTIDTAQRSGVAGFPIAVFGAGFGASQGASELRILGAVAPVTKWTDGVIEARVPAVPPAAGELAVKVGGSTATSPFVVYEIDPRFLAPPSRLENLVLGKPVRMDGTYTDWSGNGQHAPEFLTYNSSKGAADLRPGASVTVHLGGGIQGTVWFSYFGGGNWYPGADASPRDYTLEGSSDSTDGVDGAWSTLLAVTGNDRWNRSHKLVLSGQSWLRWRIGAGVSSTPIRVREIRVFRVKPGLAGAGLDAWGIMGDSITATDLEKSGDDAFYGQVMKARADGTEPMSYVMGMSGQHTRVLTYAAATDNATVALKTALDLEPDLRYWGIALGINDCGFPDPATENRKDLREGIEQVLARGKVPVLVRVADTSPTFMISAACKKALLRNADELAAEYRLVPGPDFYTTFRQHPEYISDGIHHTFAGQDEENRLWAEAILRSGIYGSAPLPEAVPPAPPTNLRRRERR